MADTARPNGEYFHTKQYEAEVHISCQRTFSALYDRNVLIYWPHGVGDWVFLSYILPLFERSNKYYVVRYGDDSSSIFDGSEFAQPLYLGINSPHSGNGVAYNNEHFGMLYDEIDGSSRLLDLPFGLYQQCRLAKIDTVLFSSFAEIHGWSAYPFHTKARNALPELAGSRLKGRTVLERPLTSCLNKHVDGWVQSWVEARLNNYTGRGKRKLCLVCRNGYTAIDKNWGHNYRELLPLGKQVEGQEARDFMSLLLSKDPDWIFLTFEDQLFSGHDTMRDVSLHSFSVAEVFGAVGGASLPYALMLKALMNVADLCIGVPAGPFHLSVTYNSFPSVGIWLEHLPSWYDEPKEAAINIIGRSAKENSFDSRPGSFDRYGALNYNVRYADSKIITGEEVLSAVEELIY